MVDVESNTRKIIKKDMKKTKIKLKNTGKIIKKKSKNTGKIIKKRSKNKKKNTGKIIKKKLKNTGKIINTVHMNILGVIVNLVAKEVIVNFFYFMNKKKLTYKVKI